VKNPNNRKLPNLFSESVLAANDWREQISLRGLDGFIHHPFNFVGSGLDYSEAYFLKDCNDRYNKIKESE